MLLIGLGASAPGLAYAAEEAALVDAKDDGSRAAKAADLEWRDLVKRLERELPVRIAELQTVAPQDDCVRRDKARDLLAKAEAAQAAAKDADDREVSLPKAQEAVVAARRHLWETERLCAQKTVALATATVLVERVKKISRRLAAQPPVISPGAHEIVGNAFIIIDGKQRPLKPGEIMPVGATIGIQGKGFMEYRLKGGGILRFGDNSRSKLTNDGGEVKKGFIYYLNKGVHKGLRRFEIKAGPANVAVRGTEFELGLEDGQSVLRPYDGRMSISISTPSASADGLDMTAVVVPAGALAVIVSVAPTEPLAAGTTLQAGASVAVAEGQIELALARGYRAHLSSGARLELKTTGADRRPVYSLPVGSARVWCAGCDPGKPILFVTPNTALTATAARWRMSVAPSGLAEIRLEAGTLDVAASIKRLDLLAFDAWWFQ